MRNFMRIIDSLRQHGFDIEVLRNLISNVSFGRIAWSVAGDFLDIENPSDGHIAQSGFNNKWVANWVSGGSGAGNACDRIRMRFEEGYSGGGGQGFVFDFDTTFGLLFQTIAPAGNINNRTRLSHRGLNVANGDESGVGLGWNKETEYNAGGVFQNRISDGALLFNLTNLGLYFYQTTRNSNDKYEFIRFGADHGSEISCNGANRMEDPEIFRIAKRNSDGDLLGKALTVENPIEVVEVFLLRSPQNRQMVQELTILHEDEIVLYGFAERMYAKKIDIPAIPMVGNGRLTIQRNGNTVAIFNANQSEAATANIDVGISHINAGNGISVGISTDTDGTRTATITNTQTTVVAVRRCSVGRGRFLIRMGKYRQCLELDVGRIMTWAVKALCTQCRLFQEALCLRLYQ
ncbi:MAG: hypothetical protein FWE23_08760 [Chitinivibrionia bacterium]|nr:hypothetical protein [Chitinivibrionia bacterium]